MNDDLVVSRNKAEESDTLKSAFLANMSHEIRTPMNAIMGFAEFLTQPGLAQEKFEQFAQIIKISSHQLLTIINDILDISKIEAGQIIISSENLNINQLLKALYLIYKEQAEFKKISLSYSCGLTDDRSQTLTDENRLKQVLCNLLNNALKFTSGGKIEYGYTLKENNIEFYVKDNGIGIAPENHSLVFNRFRQVDTKDTREYGGNGLGLSISKALVEKLGGAITVTSALGKGSTFIFTIPYIQKIETISNVEKTIEADIFEDWQGKTILLAEDEVHSHMYIEELFADSGIQMLHAWNGKEAVEIVKKRRDILLVLMDIKMPVMDGYEALRLIKKFRPKLPVVVQTAYAQSDDRLNALHAGCDNYFSKPIQKDLFLKAIASYLIKGQISNLKC
jgi:CheY-like chemotaxis protein